MKSSVLQQAQRMAKKVTDRLAGPKGAGLFGVEFFIRGKEVIFSELSPRPHDTGMVTMISQDLSEFELHLPGNLGTAHSSGHRRSTQRQRGDFGLKDQDLHFLNYRGLDAALQVPETEIRIFGKPTTRKWRRMGSPCPKAIHSNKHELERRKQRAWCAFPKEESRIRMAE